MENKTTPLLAALREQKEMKMKGGIYHKFKECLRYGIVPFVITDEFKMFYYRGLREWGHIDGYLTDTCLTAQDQYKAALDYFRINWN